ncbi:hypothetical protein OAE39_02075 [Akkermansiaceae bacterium]|nr:hypothetical protein [Akkermansiaceae bacterium]
MKSKQAKSRSSPETNPARQAAKQRFTSPEISILPSFPWDLPLPLPASSPLSTGGSGESKPIEPGPDLELPGDDEEE